MGHIMARITEPNLGTKTCFALWTMQRQALLCTLSQLFNVSPFAEERSNNQSEHLEIFCEQLLAYISKNHFQEINLADLPTEPKIIAKMLTMLTKILAFCDKYTDFKYASLKIDLNADLFIISQALTDFLDLEEILLADCKALLL